MKLRGAATSRISTVLPLAAVLAAGCAAAVPNITEASPGEIVADPSAVTLVIVQPVTHLRSVGLLDGHGQLVGQLDDRSHTVIRVPEGPTLLYAVLDNHAETADRIEGTLVAGRVYFATVSARADGVALLTLNPRSPDGRWSHKAEYLATTPGVRMDPRRLVRAVNELGDPAAILRAGDAHAIRLDAAGLAEHTIQESDGF